jgi:hypothetical protein
MLFPRSLVPFAAAFSLVAGGLAFMGCQSDSSSTPSSTSGDTMSGAGGGNGTYGGNPAQAMHNNPAETQPAAR